MLKVLELFSGIGSQTQALKNIGVEHISTQCDIDKYAVNVYNQLHGETKNLGDISKLSSDDFSENQWDLITYSFPCTDISLAGHQKGFSKESGTRSSLLWECEKIFRKVKPKYLLMENVKNLVSKKFIPYFQEWLKVLENIGYKNYWKILNAKDFGVPQNRERVFCVSILGDHEPYEFPQPKQLNIRLKDVLEKEVDEKYYLSEQIQQRFKIIPNGKNIIGTTAPENRTIGQRDFVYKTDSVIGSLIATDYKQPKQIIEFDMPNGKRAEITNNVNEPNCFKEVRTEQGKLGRKLARQQGLGDTTPRDKDSKMFITKNDGVANCLTTTCGVEQIIVEPTLNYLGGIGEPNRLNDGKELSRNYKEGYRVYDSDGLSSTIKANGGGLGGCSSLYMVNEPVIVASRGRYTDKDDPTKTEQQLELNDSGLSNTITTVQKDNYVAEPKIINPLKGKTEYGWHFEQNVYDVNSVSRAIKAGEGSGNMLKIIDSSCNPLRIRKLTPKECWRLMGWKDEQIDKVKGISNSQLYKQAGNSIVVNVLEEIFRKLFFK